jgi:hypothetical protein
MLAELLTSKGTTMFDLDAGEKLGKRVGWSPSRLATLTQEQYALMQVFSTFGDNRWDCASIGRENEFISQIARLGEVAAARDALEHSGNTVEEMAQKQMETNQKIRSATLQQQEAMPVPRQP